MKKKKINHAIEKNLCFRHDGMIMNQNKTGNGEGKIMVPDAKPL